MRVKLKIRIHSHLIYIYFGELWNCLLVWIFGPPFTPMRKPLSCKLTPLLANDFSTSIQDAERRGPSTLIPRSTTTRITPMEFESQCRYIEPSYALPVEKFGRHWRDNRARTTQSRMWASLIRLISPRRHRAANDIRVNRRAPCFHYET